MPRSAKPDEIVRVRLIPIEGKVDRSGLVMYRTEYAPVDLVEVEKNSIASEAAVLRASDTLPKEQGEAVLRAKGVAGVSSYGWYYFCGDEVFGSRFSPAALQALEFIPRADDGGVLELVFWMLNEHYFVRTQERGEKIEAPEIVENDLAALRGKLARGEKVLSEKIL
ncbi:MAG: hypothetical protein Q7S34_00595 [bacterium]|nr:hypothetical protein [bacterium]